MATNYERLINCTQQQLEYFFDSLVHKKASAYVDWSKWLGSEDPEAPYIGEEAFYLDDGNEKNCRFLEESKVHGETYRTIYEVLPKGDIKQEALPAHLVRLATEEEYPEEDPLRKLIDDSVAEYANEPGFSAYLYSNPGSNHENTASIVVEEIEEEVLPESTEETVNIDVQEEPILESIEETVNIDTQEEPVETVETIEEEPVIAEEVIEDIPTTEIDTPIEESEAIELTLEPEVEELTPLEKTMEIGNTVPSSIEVSEAEEFTNRLEGILDSLPPTHTDNIEETKVIESLNSFNADAKPENLEETIVFDANVEAELPEKEEIIPQEETLVINKLDDLKTLENVENDLDNTAELTIEEVVNDDNKIFNNDELTDLEQELAGFENTMSELESIVNDPGPSLELTNSHALNLSETIHEYEEDTEVEIHDLLDDIKSRSTLFDPEDPDDRELPTIAFMAMNSDEE